MEFIIEINFDHYFLFDFLYYVSKTDRKPLLPISAPYRTTLEDQTAK